MSNRLVFDGNTVYEIDEECIRQGMGAAAAMWKNLPGITEDGKERPPGPAGGRENAT